ncbi:MAG: hypothetical protein ACT4P3_01900 [Betaproteobacteria bacterium]
MLNTLRATLLVAALSGCDAVTGAFETVKEGIAQAQAVSDDIEKATGARPGVSVNWKNGELDEVRLDFETVPKDLKIADLAEQARASVRKRLTREPKQLLIAFSIAAK